jgi:hypothetical protein
MNYSLLTHEPAADSAMRNASMPVAFRAAGRITAAWAVLKALAPYAAIELLLPGGSVLAIICWLYRRRRIA